MIHPLLQLAALCLIVFVVYFCGAKALLLAPLSIGLFIAGGIGDWLLRTAAGGTYADSDTLIYFPPRNAGSAAAWYQPATWAMVGLVIIVWLIAAIVCLWPKRAQLPHRPVFFAE